MRLEARVDQGLAGTDDALAALLEIRRRRLHEAATADVAGDEPRWWAYVRRRWPHSERHVRRLLAAAEVVENVAEEAEEDEEPSGPDGHSPTRRVRSPNEAQAREMNRLTGRPEAQKRVWDAARRQARAEGRRVTATLVRESVDRLLAAEAEDDPTPEQVRGRQEELAGRSRAAAEARAVAEVSRLLERAALAAQRLPPGQVRDEVDRGLRIAAEALGAAS